MASIQQPRECFTCGSNDFEYIKPQEGNAFVLTSIDQSVTPARFLATSGMPVHALGCTNCGTISLHVPGLKKS